MIRNVSMFVIYNLKRVFHTQLKCVFILYRHTNVHMPSFNISLITIVKQKALGGIRTRAMLFICLLQKCTKKQYFSKISCLTTFQDHKLSGVNIGSSSNSRVGHVVITVRRLGSLVNDIQSSQ